MKSKEYENAAKQCEYAHSASEKCYGILQDLVSIMAINKGKVTMDDIKEVHRLMAVIEKIENKCESDPIFGNDEELTWENLQKHIAKEEEA